MMDGQITRLKGGICIINIAIKSPDFSLFNDTSYGST